MTTRFSLKLFLLVCLLSSMLVAWIAIGRMQLHDESTHAKSQQFSWTSFSESGGHAGDEIGGFRTDGNGVITHAHVRDAYGFDVLADFAGGCERLPSLLIYGPEAYASFKPEDFRGLEQLTIAGVPLSSDSLQSLVSLPNLRKLALSDFTNDPNSDPVSSLQALTELSTLRDLKLESEMLDGLSSFPDLQRIERMVIYHPGAQPKDLQNLRQHLPDCNIRINVGTMRNPVWLQ